MGDEAYVLITAAKNEQDYIEKTIRAVAAQTVLPKQWIIVSDGSTDRTEDIVEQYARRCRFIKLVKLGASSRRDFAAKVNAIRTGCAQLQNVEHEFWGNLDADVTFEPRYYEMILQKFGANPLLGIAGGLIFELIGERFVVQNTSLNSVAGAVQLFRRRCFEEVGGYFPLPGGGEDAVAEISARMKGWEVQTFPELKIWHHRRVSAGNAAILKTKFRHGARDYALGYHPLFYALLCAYRIIDRPYLLGSLLRMCGFCWSALRRKERAVSVDLVRYLRMEQMQRLRALFPLGGGKLVKTSRIGF